MHDARPPPPAADAPTISDAPPAVRPVHGGTGESLSCPLCEYDLRGLTEPRCPECGYRFAWADLTDPARRRHPYLFEHHPGRNLWSFTQTLVRGWLPSRFWTSIHPAQRSRPGRLIFYWCAAASVLIVALGAHYVMQGVEVADEMLRRRTLMVQVGYPPADLDHLCPLPPSARFYDRVWERDTAWTWRLAGLWLAWPWLVFVTMLLFRVSMRRARIRPAHVLRCVLYSCDAVLWLGALVAMLVALRALHWYGVGPPRVLVPPAPVPEDHFFRYTPHPVTDALFWGAFLMLILTGYRLAMAFRRYLRFDHPAATVVAAYLIAALSLLVALVLGWV